MRIIPRFHLFFVVITLCVVAVLPACGKLNVTPEQHVAKAEEFIEKDELEAAAIELRNALKASPNMLEARWLLGTVALKLGDAVTAEKELKRSLELGLAPKAVQPALTRAILLQGDFDRVLAETTQLAPGMSGQDQALILALRGRAHLLKSQFDSALLMFNESLEIDPSCTDALVGMASLHGIQRDQDEARRWVDQALASDDSSPLAWSTLGNIELADGSNEEAEAAFTNAIELLKYPSLDIAKRALARTQLGKFTESDADLQVLAKSPLGKHPYVSYVQGLSYFRQQKYAEAAEAFQVSYQGTPSSLPLLFYLASTHHILGNLEQAQLYAERAYNLAPRSLASRQALSAVHISLSQLDAAKSLLEAPLLEYPDDPVILQMLAVVAYLEGDTAKNVEYMQKIAALKPDSQRAITALNIARLLDGQPLEGTDPNAQAASGAVEEQFTQGILSVVEAFKHNDYAVALERAQQLQERYPEKVEPVNLMSAIYLASGQWDKGRVELERALEIDADNRSAARNLAVLEARDGNLERARTLLEAVVPELPQDEDAILLLADIESRLGGEAEGIRVLEQALERYPQLPSVITELANAYFRAKRYTAVLTVTGNLNDEQLGENPRLLELRGKAQMLSQDVPAATVSFGRLVQAVPDSVEARYVYADSLHKAGDRKRAQQELQRVVEMDPDHLPARLRLVRLLVESDERTLARKKMAEIEKEYGEKPEILGLYGWLLLLEGDYAAAEEQLAKASAQWPDTDQTGYLVKALWEQQKYDQAIQVMLDWLERYPQDLAVQLRLASAYLSMGKATEARSSYAAIVEHYPGFVPALNNLAYLLGQEGYSKEAIVYAERAYELNPDDPTVLDTLGTLLLKTGEVRRGYGLVRKAAERAPKDLDIQLHLGQALVQQKQYEEAQQVLETIIAKGPDSQPAAKAKTLLQSMP